MFGTTQSMKRTACAMALGLVIQFTVPAMSADAPAQPGSPIPATPTRGTPPSATAPLPPPAPTPAPPPADASAAAEVAQLRSTLADLEKRVAELEENKNEITAPFRVVNKNGEMLFYVGESSPGQTQVDILGNDKIYITTDSASSGIKIIGQTGTTTSLRAAAGKPYLEIAGANKTRLTVEDDEGGGLELKVAAGDASVELTAKPGAPSLRVIGPNDTAFIGKSTESFGYYTLNASGQTMASLNDTGGGKYALKILPPDGSGPVVQAGYHKSGRPGFSLWNGSNKLAHLDSDEARTSGELELMNNNNIIALMSASFGGVLSFLDDQSNETVSIGRLEENTNGMRVRDGNEKVVELVGREKSGELALSSKGNIAALLSSADGGVLDFLDANLEETATFGTIQEGVTGMRIRDKGKAVIELIGRPDATGLYINKDEKLRAFVGMQTDGTPTHSIFDETGRLAELTQEGTSGSLLIYDKGKVTLSAGLTEGKALPAFRAWDNGKMKFAAGASNVGGVAVVYNNSDQVAAGMEGYAVGGGKVYAYANGKELVSINTIESPGNGIVAVRSPDGNTNVALMRNGTNGGGNFTAMDPTGGGVASLGYTPGGPGTVCVVHKGTQCLGIGLTGLEGFH